VVGVQGARQPLDQLLAPIHQALAALRVCNQNQGSML
jgi:hypothetical protein